MQIIDTQKKLEDNLLLIASEKIIGVDTEFVRKKTYWPELSLIQLVSESVELIVDIQSELDLTVLWEVFRNKKILKVFHSCKQDIEAIFYLSDVIPISVYDTQIGAMFCGYKEPISYAKIVEDFLNIKLDKDLQYSEWGKRPLKKEMYEYAINDAKYLIRLQKLLEQRIGKSQKKYWLDEEFSHFSFIEEFKKRKRLKKSDLYNIDNYIIDHNGQELKKFREDLAILKNIPRKFILSDKEIHSIRKEKPNDINQLNRLIDSRSYIKKDGDIYRLFANLVFSSNSHPNLVNKKNKTKLTKQQKNIIRQLDLKLIEISTNLEICPYILASKFDIRTFVQDNDASVKFLNGWRYDAFGKLAIKSI